MKRISIIIPHFDSWDMLKELLHSIPSNEIIEVIVIDDHSEKYTENFREIKKEFPQVMLVSNQENKKGAGSARNMGLSIASGEWLLFADADDLFSKDFITTIKKYIDSDNDIIYFSPKSFGKANVVRHKPYKKYVDKYLEEKTLNNELNLRYKFVVPWSKLIRRSIVATHDIRFEEIMYSNDILFSAKTGYVANGIEGTNETIYSVRETSTSLTSVKSEEAFNLRYIAWIDYVSFIKNRLSNNEFKLLHFSVIPHIYSAIKNNMEHRTLSMIIRKAKINDIPILDSRLINPKFIIKLLIN